MQSIDIVPIWNVKENGTIRAAMPWTDIPSDPIDTISNLHIKNESCKWFEGSEMQEMQKRTQSQLLPGLEFIISGLRCSIILS